MNLNKNSPLYASVGHALTHLDESDQQWLNKHPNEQTLIQQAFAASELLAKICGQFPGTVAQLNGDTVSSTSSDEHKARLRQTLVHCSNETDLWQALRVYQKAQLAQIIYLDVLGKQSIEASLQAVSVLADALILATYNWLYAFCADKYGTPENAQPLCIIAMGKLGGSELNFSSDIDLIFAFPSKGETNHARKPIEHQLFFTRVAQKLITALDKVTQDGQVYRVDMRLRPFGESGPLVAHFDALTDYYQEHAREWERYALVKGRIINPVDQYTEELTGILAPFVYKRYLDFTTLDALRDMKRRIDADTRKQRLNDNIKLGKGGIREAEFFVQTFQMIHGGRNTSLRKRNWLAIINVLVSDGHLSPQDACDLRTSYLLLRKVEHSLQQIRNEQTQTLPLDESDWHRLIISTQHEDIVSLKHTIQSARTTIHKHFQKVFSEPGQETAADTPLVKACRDCWLADYNEQDITDRLQEWRDISFLTSLAQSLISFKQQAEKAFISPKGRQQLNELIPQLMADVLSDQNTIPMPMQPSSNAGHYSGLELGFQRSLDIIQAVLGRTTYLGLLVENPGTRKHLLSLTSGSPWIAKQLQRFPMLLDELLSPVYLQQQTSDIPSLYKQMEDDLRQSLLRIDYDDVELHMDVLRQFKLCTQLRIAAADLHGTLPVEKVSDALTVLAEVLLNHVINTAYAHMCKRYGQPEGENHSGEAFCSLAYGKMGGYELGYGSDLDLVFIHNASRETLTTGSKPINAPQFYIKMSQRVMHLLTTKTLLGPLYETDLRLRPAGNAGLLCCHIEGFRQYQEDEAWTWEHQALVRARPVYGNPKLREQVNRIRTQALSRKRKLASLQEAVVNMRAKLFEHHKEKTGTTQFKHQIGGITDIEFLGQYWVLAYSHQCPTLLKWTDNLRILDEASAMHLLSVQDAVKLKEAYLVQRSHMHHCVLLERALTPIANIDEATEEEQMIGDLQKQVATIWRSTLPSYTEQSQSQTQQS